MSKEYEHIFRLLEDVHFDMAGLVRGKLDFWDNKRARYYGEGRWEDTLDETIITASKALLDAKE